MVSIFAAADRDAEINRRLEEKYAICTSSTTI